MSSDWLKRAYEIFGRTYPRLTMASSAVLGASIFAGTWWLIGQGHSKSSPPQGRLDVLYATIGVPYPKLSLLVAALVGAVVFAGACWMLGKEMDHARKVGEGEVVFPPKVTATPPLEFKNETGKVEVADRLDKSIPVYYARPFVRAPRLDLEVRGGWAKIETLEERADGFVFRASELIGTPCVLWTAQGEY